MTITVTAAAESLLLTTVPRLQVELDETGNEVELEILIAEASAAVERFTDRPFAKERVTETLEGFNRPKMILGRTPIVTVHEVQFKDTTVTSTSYSVDNAKAGVMFRKTGWLTTELLTQHIVLQPIGIGTRDWSFDYTAGYVLPSFSSTEDRDLPYDIERAVIETAKAWRRSRDRDPTIKSEKIGDFWAASYKDQMLPDRVVSLLEPWRRIF